MDTCEPICCCISARALTDLMHTLRSSGGMCVTVPLEWVLISVLPRMREKPKSAADGGTTNVKKCGEMRPTLKFHPGDVALDTKKKPSHEHRPVTLLM